MGRFVMEAIPGLLSASDSDDDDKPAATPPPALPPPGVPPRTLQSHPPSAFRFARECTKLCCVPQLIPSPPPSPNGTDTANAAENPGKRHAPPGTWHTPQGEQQKAPEGITGAVLPPSLDDPSYNDTGVLPRCSSPFFSPPTIDMLTDDMGDYFRQRAEADCDMGATEEQAPPASSEPPAPQELTDDELALLAKQDAADLNLDAKELAKLLQKRRDTATLEVAHGLSAWQSARLHAFRLFRDESGTLFAECLVCERSKAAQKGNFFLNNFSKAHIGSVDRAPTDGQHIDCVQEARERLLAATAGLFSQPASSGDAPEPQEVEPEVLEPGSTRSGGSFGASTERHPEALLSESELHELAVFDSSELSVEQRDAIDRLRVWIHGTLEGGVLAHPFRVTLVEGVWHVDCAACGTRSPAYLASGINFLNHFTRHLKRPNHQTAAANRMVAVCHALLDAANASAADAQAAARVSSAAASAPPSTTQMELEHGARVASHAVEEAQAALLRAEQAAQRARALAAGEAEPHASRGTVLDQPLAATDLERLVGATPALDWDEDEQGVRCGVRCTWCNVRVSSDVVQVHNVQEHLGSKRHRDRATYGGRTIASFFGKRPAVPAPPPRPPPDCSDLCLGYYKPSLALEAGVADLRSLLEETPAKSAPWRPDRWFSGRLVVAAGGGEQTTTEVQGTLRATDCRRFCVGADGRRATDGMCDACRKLPSDPVLRRMLSRRVAAAARRDCDATRVRFDLLPRDRLIELLRERGIQLERFKHQLWLMRQSYLRKAARVRQLKERLNEQTLRGDVKALVADIIAIDKAGKFKQRQTLLHFLRDLVHSLRSAHRHC